MTDADSNADPGAAPEAARVVERVVRESYGRLVAYLGARWRDLAAVEDALGDALAAALAKWPSEGIPERPEAWLATAARRKLIDQARRRATQIARPTPPAARHAAEEPVMPAEDIPDERLKLLFVCAHPAIDPAARTPLMLQAVLGLDAATIASAFLVAPATMSQRLVRAKAKIRDAAVPFDVPEPARRAERLDSVLETIYAAFGLAWDEAGRGEGKRGDLSDEAIWLARIVAGLLPGEPEALGLLALLLFLDSRGRARRDLTGAYVPLSEQDTSLWRVESIEEAEETLRAASRVGRIGPFQLEAAIQSAHCARRHTGTTDWRAIRVLYEALVDQAPTTGVRIGRAAAVARAESPARALALLDEIDPAVAARYQPYWALRADLLARAGDNESARAAFARALGLSDDAAVRKFLEARLAELP